MTDIEKAIEILSNMRLSLGRSTAKNETAIAIAQAVLALSEKSARENPQPLTLNQLKALKDGMPVYIVISGDIWEHLEFWALVEYNGVDVFLTNNLGGRSNISEIDCNWVAYDYPPKEATPCQT